MQKTEIIDKNKLFELIEFIFVDSEVQFYESYSEMEMELKRINSFSEFIEYYAKSISENEKHLGFGIYYPKSNGKVLITKFELDPKRCKGKTYRYNIEGWAIIYIHLDLINYETEIGCRISVNTKKRAENWEETYPEFGKAETWDWKIIESIARKIINKIKKTTANSGLAQLGF